MDIDKINLDFYIKAKATINRAYRFIWRGTGSETFHLLAGEIWSVLDYVHPLLSKPQAFVRNERTAKFFKRHGFKVEVYKGTCYRITSPKLTTK